MAADIHKTCKVAAHRTQRMHRSTANLRHMHVNCLEQLLLRGSCAAIAQPKATMAVYKALLITVLTPIQVPHSGVPIQNKKKHRQQAYWDCDNRGAEFAVPGWCHQCHSNTGTSSTHRPSPWPVPCTRACAASSAASGTCCRSSVLCGTQHRSVHCL